jgi:hypothetical protein
MMDARFSTGHDKATFVLLETIVSIKFLFFGDNCAKDISLPFQVVRNIRFFLDWDNGIPFASTIIERINTDKYGDAVQSKFLLLFLHRSNAELL